MNAKLLAAARRAPRPACRLLRVSEEGRWTALLCVAGAQGSELVTDRPVKPAMLLTIFLPAGPRLLSVTRTHALPGGRQWLVEGTFVKEDCRTVPLNVCFPLVRATEEGPWATAVRGVSPKGLELLTGRSFSLGSYITVQLLTPSSNTGRTRLLQVTRVREEKAARGWLVGGVLLSRLSDQELTELTPPPC